MLSNRKAYESIRQRNTGVKGEECDGTLRESVAQAAKQGGTAGISINSLSLELTLSKVVRGQAFLIAAKLRTVSS